MNKKVGDKVYVSGTINTVRDDIGRTKVLIVGKNKDSYVWVDSDKILNMSISDATEAIRALFTLSHEVRNQIFSRVDISSIVTSFDVKEIKDLIDEYNSFPRVGDICTTKLWLNSVGKGVVTTVGENNVGVLRENGEVYNYQLKEFKEDFTRVDGDPRDIFAKIFTPDAQ